MKSRLMHVFRRIDTDHSGTISKPELIVGLKSLFEGSPKLKQLSDDEITKVFIELDLNHDDQISQEEFLAKLGLHD